MKRTCPIWAFVGVLTAFGQQAGGLSNRDLLGEWTRGHVSSVDFVNPSTGAHADPSGERLSVRFLPDGTYRLGWLLQSSLYNCSSRVFGYKTGAYTVEGSSVTLEDTSSTLTSHDTCHREWNYEKHPPLRRTTYTWTIAQSKYGPELVMRAPDGTQTVYDRERGKGTVGRVNP